MSNVRKFKEDDAQRIQTDITPGSIAEALVTLNLEARTQGKHMRVFDIRYCTQGIPSQITDEYVMFPPGSYEILDTGKLSGPPQNFEELDKSRMIAIHAVIQAEVCEMPKGASKN